MLIHQFLEQVQKNPDAIAIKTRDRELNYAALGRLSNRVANYIIQHFGDEKANEQKAALLFEHGADMIIGTLGALKADKVYIPFDPSYPEARLLYMLKHSTAELIVTNSKNLQLAEVLASKASRSVGIMNIDDIGNTVLDTDIQREARGERLAYILYTSGSTGMPKGVMQNHKNVLHFVSNYIERHNIKENDRMTLFSAFSHDAAVIDIFSGLLSGATLYPLNVRQQIAVEKLYEWLLQEEITIWHSVPTLYRYFVNTLTGEEKPLRLRYIVLGGESVLEQDVTKFRKSFEGVGLVNLYGQSEASYNSSQLIADEEEYEGLHLGESIKDSRLLVLNDRGKIAAPFSAGEIVVASEHIALGYWNDIEKTEQAFENHPELGRIYRTGDLGRFNEDNYIEYIGRKDFQIKINGYRVELEEIENCLREHTGIKDAAIVGKEDKNGVRYLCGYYTADAELEVEAVREYIAAKLPYYMIPAFITRLDKLPLTPTGKVDRKALLEMKETAASEKQYEAPRNELEEKLVGLWQEVLGIERIGITDSFFELGGHSLNAVSLIRAIHKALNVELPLREIFRTPTIKALAECIEGLEESRYFSIEQSKSREYYELSSSQKRMYILQQMEPESISYNMPGVLVIEGELDVEQLKRAMKGLVERHEALRTSFKRLEEEIVQIVHEEVEFEVAYGEYAEEEIDDVIGAFVSPFDLSRAPLFRVGLITLPKEKHILIYDMHHIISDGESVAILVDEFAKLYQGQELSALRLQYKDYVIWQSKPENMERIKRQSKYWLELLKGEIPLLAMPLDYERKVNKSFTGKTVYRELQSYTVEKLVILAQKENTTLNILLLSCYNILLSKYSGQEDIIIGSLVSNRNHSDLSHVMGAFINYLPIRTKLEGEESITAFLEYQKSVISQAYNNKEYPFDQIVRDIDYKVESGRNPLFDTMLIYHNEFNRKADIKIDKLNISQYEFDTLTSTLDFKLDLYMDRQNILKCYLEYNTDLYKEETMEQFLRHYEMVVESVINNTDARLFDIQVFNQPEQKEIEKKRMGNNTTIPHVTLNIAATFTVQPVEEYIRWWCEKHGTQVKIQFAPYNQVFQELLDPGSMTSQNSGINLLMVRFEDWLRDIKVNGQEQKDILESQYNRLMEAIKNKNSAAFHIICVFPVAYHLGLSDEITGSIENLNMKLLEETKHIEGISVLDFTETAHLYDIKETFDAVKDRAGHMPFSDEYYAAIGTVIARKVCAIRHNPFKVIAVDCDNTLWRGICGEDGTLGVKVERPYAALQKLLIEKQEEGMLIVLCSKNNEADVWEVFDRHHGMKLRREHIAAWRINWQAKSENMKQLAEELKLGIDSFIFIDDNPAECYDMMKKNPQVLTLQLPEEPQQIENYLKHIWAFDKEKITAEDRMRTKLYQAEKKRKEIQSSGFTLEEFLKELKPKIFINDLKKEQLARASQLTQRTNQFNLSTIRRTEDEVSVLLQKPQTKCWAIEVEDRFGEYGLTGFLVMECRPGCLYIDTLLLSCRVLGRSVEAAIIAELGKCCLKEGISKIEADYYPSGKNQMVADYLENNQWRKIEETGKYAKYEILVEAIAMPIPYIECYYGDTYKKQVTKSTVREAESRYAVQEDAAATRENERENEKPTIENSWKVNIENEEALQHINYILPLLYCTGQRLLQLPTGKNKKNAINHQAYEVAYTPLEEKLVELWEEVLKTDGIGINDNFFDLGGNSYLLLTLHSKIDKLYPDMVKVTDLFYLTNIKKIAAYIAEKEAGKERALEQAEERTVKDKIAIIGISAKLPLGKTIEEIYASLKNGMDCIKKMPEGRRKDIEDYAGYAGYKPEMTEFLKHIECAFIGDIDKFDYNFFNISPKEASLMDPCQRLFLETAWEAVEDSGYGGNRLKGSRTGVYVGNSSVASGTYSNLVTMVDPALFQMSIAGNIPMVIASRISYMLDLRGPAMLIDTACSSSLVAVYSACSAIRNNDCDMAIAGGIRIFLPSLESLITSTQKIGIESSDYRTRAFDDSSDGTGGGEGTAAVLLKPLSKAIEDGDHIYAVISGGAINQDGNSIGITAPNPEAQEELLLRAWKNAGVVPENITYIEAHGTGTKLGDQIELESLSKAFGRYSEKKQFCAIGTIKTNIGHLDAAAGIAGLLKAVISLKHKELFPNLHFNTPRRDIDFIDSPFYVSAKHQAWQTNGLPRICGVSAFGIGGTNCHMILEEAPARYSYAGEWAEKPQILAISAKTENSLKRLVERYKAYFDNGMEGRLTDICYTANTGRGHYKYRLAIIAGSRRELEEKISSLKIGNLSGDEEQGIYYSHDALADNIVSNFETAFKHDEKISEKSLEELCSLYIKGAEINWHALFQNADKKRKVRLPVYQFEESRCWLAIPETSTGPVIEKQEQIQQESQKIKEVQLEGKNDEDYTQTERLIGQVLAEVMDFESLDIYEDFFELGGDSLIAMEVVNGINKKLLTNVKVRDLLKNPTICEFCSLLDEEYLKKRIEGDSIGSIRKVEEREYYPVSSAQKRVYVLNMLESNSTFYNLPSVAMLSGNIDRLRFEKAFHKLIERHESLRTSFEIIDGNPVQKIHKAVDFQINYMEGNEDSIDGLIKGFMRPFDLSISPLMRVGLFEISEDKHLLMFDIHHIIVDGLSNSIIIKEYMHLYNGEALSPLALQYKDYAVWQNEQINTEMLSKQKEYWLNVFSGELPVLNMPADFPRPSIQSFDGDHIRIELSKEISEALNKRAAEAGTTLFAVLLAAYNVLLHKYTGQEDIIIGSPISGRRDTQLMNVIGMFANTIALRNKPVGSKTFNAFLAEVKENALAAYDRQDYQFEDLVEHLNIHRDLSRNPLFDVMLSLQNSDVDMDAIKAGEVNAQSYELDFGIAKFDLTVTVIERKENIGIVMEYCSRLFKKDTIEKMGRHFVNILEKVAEQPDVKLQEIQIISEEEKQQLLWDFNATEAKYPKERTVCELFEEQVEKTPDNVAVVYEDKQLTYKELNEKANQLARLLREKGVAPDTIVGIMVERSLEMVIGIMGILKAGGAYLPIDPELPIDRIHFMLKDSQAEILLTQEKLKVFTKFQKTTICIDNLKNEYGCYDNPRVLNQSTDLAYVIYTSGSTGNPKGVMIEHRSVINLVQSLYDRIFSQYEEKQKVALVASYAFDASVQQIFGALLLGHSLYIVPNTARTNGKELIDYFNQKGIDISDGTPVHINMLLQALNEERLNLPVSHLIIGGDVLPGNSIKDLITSAGSSIKITNIYGPTECCVDSTSYFVESSNWEISIPIGKPLLNTRIYIVDKANNLQPIGIPGELCIAGDGLARGYLNRPELTAEKFVENPFEPGGRMYRTGDLASWLSDGNIEFLGRMDHQVKIRGFRIELGEIESRLLAHEAVKEAVIIAKEEENRNKYLCAYIVGEKEATVNELREYLSKELPDHMVPSYFIQLDKLPLTPNGKIDRKALPEPKGNISIGTEYEAPGNMVEEKLVRIWEEVLKVEKVGINDNFFALGGHSLKATSMVSKIHKELYVEVPLKEVFKTPTIKGLAEYIKRQEKIIYESIEPVEEKEYYQLSSAQKRLYTLQQFEPESTGYNMSGVLEVEGKLDIEKMKEAFNKLIQRHETLRTCFELVGEEVLQKVYKEVNFEIEYMDDVLSKEEADKATKEFIRPFDLSKAPLLRVKLARIQLQRDMPGYILMYDMHHIISDGTSIGILVEELMKLYESKELPELRIQYKDYASWQNKMVKTDKMQQQENYWLKIFEGELPVLNLPADYPRPAIQSLEGAEYVFTINGSLYNQLKKLAEEIGTTLFMVLLGLFSVELSKCSGQEDMVIGTVTAGRTNADLQSLIGIFLNNIAFRCMPGREKTFIEYLEELKYEVLNAYENQNYPIEELIRKLDIRKDISRNALFDVMIILQNFDQNDIEIAATGLNISPYPMAQNTSDYDMSLYVYELPGELKLRLQYSTKLFKTKTIRNFVKHFINLSNKLIKTPDKQLGQVEMTDEEERHKLLHGFNGAGANYPADKTIQQLFEEQVERTPENIAAVYNAGPSEDKVLTYKELNERANQLARHLRDKGAGQIVGIMTDRSLEMLIGIMGILKAGCAYLPIDPVYPEERISFMIEDSGTNLLLTRKHLLGSIRFQGEIMDLEAPDLYEGDGSNLGINYSPQDLIYVIYTSGTTGKPKGILTEHRNVIAYVNTFNENFSIGEKDATLQQASMTFDGFVEEVYTILIKGGKVVIPENEEVKDAGALRELIIKNQVTILSCSPLILSEFNKLQPMPSVHTFLSSSDILKKEYMNNILQYSRIFNMYGPSEATVCATCYSCSGMETGSIPIGSPLKHTRTYILDNNNHVQPVGIAGELCIAGEGVARGYLNRPELTAEKFVENLFEPGTRMYRTGDLAKWLPDGNIEFLGRIDQQVKIRGYRIELGEIESQLLLHENLKETVVLAKEDVSGSKYLCAYIVAEKELTVRELRGHLSKALPDNMIPSYFIQLKKMQLTPNGKIDKKALPEPDGDIRTGVEYEAARNEIEGKLVKIWQEVLRVEKIGINDNFFALGGHSLRATGVMARIHKELNVVVPLKEIFIAPTIKELAKYIKEQEENIYESIEPVEEREYYELSSAQKRLYTLQQFENEGTAYNMPGVLSVEGELDVERLEQAFKSLIERHGSLRTSFELIGEEIVQKVHKEAAFKLEYRTAKEDEIDGIIKGFVRAFDLNKVPLLRVGLVKVQPQKHILMYVMHHIISDGTSMVILVDDIVRLYMGEKLPELRLQYKDYAAWQNSYMKSEVIKLQEEYWMKEYEGGIPVLNLPADYPRSAVQSFDGDRIRLELGADITEGLRKIAKETSTTMYMVLLAGFSILLSKYSGQDDIVIGSPIAGRPHTDLSNIIGMFVNTLAIRSNPEGGKTYAEYLEEVKGKCLKAYENQDYQFEELVEKLNIKRDMSRNPIFDVILVLQNTEQEELRVEELKFSEYETENKVTKFDIAINAVEKKNSIKIEIEYCTKLFSKETIKNIARHLSAIMKQIIQNPESRIYDINVFDAAEMDEIMNNITIPINDTEVTFEI